MTLFRWTGPNGQVFPDHYDQNGDVLVMDTGDVISLDDDPQVFGLVVTDPDRLGAPDEPFGTPPAPAQ